MSLGAHAVTSAAGLRLAIDAYCPRNTASVGWVGRSGQAHTATVVFTAAPVGGLAPLMSMVMACGHGACVVTIFSATTGACVVGSAGS